MRRRWTSSGAPQALGAAAAARNKPASSVRPEWWGKRIGQPYAGSHPHLAFTSEHDVIPGITRTEMAARRRALLQGMPPRSLALVAANPQYYMSTDIPYMYHPNTNLAYLTGLQEPDSLLVCVKGDSEEYTRLLVRPRDVVREQWDGPRIGAERAAYVLGMSHVDELRGGEALRTVLEPLIDSARTLYFDPDVNAGLTLQLRQVLSPAMFKKLAAGPDKVPEVLLRMRLLKSESERVLLHQAAHIMSDSLNETIRWSVFSARSSPAREIPEAHVAARLEFECRVRGADKMSFPPVVASGERSTTLHYITNDHVAKAGDLILVDAGCELHGYCSDVSRAWPVSGRFSAPQRDVYSMLLEVEQACIALCRDKVVSHLDELHAASVLLIEQGLVHLKALPMSSTSRRSHSYFNYYPHSIGHYLGMDVHDVHSLPKNIPFEVGMAFTIEPGVYFPPDDDRVSPHFRGLGMRIEDDMLFEEHGKLSVLSDGAVKTVEEIESLIT
ncbi:putative Xaa-Pro aminopeptidase 3 [Porphyridium purpureum]|uniref:Putative Xaa-Pro aminopeptidase 3 n=1 Tax=Porphyridium purpureum TaxID=35688 RepID=A0A5J4Z542_PORPP|nr:putative Xaa-Pro aminopeptidase 3 [Porphyridium purpureum]|eukprot:POR7986..scf295_1